MKNFYVPDRHKGRTGYQIMPDRFYRPPEDNKLPHIPFRIIKDWDDVEPNWKPDIDLEFRNRYFYGGNLHGITAKLDFIKKMGFNLIYINPIYWTEEYHHYDVEDHLKIDPYLGSMNDLQKMIRQAHQKGILIILDMVFNHMNITSGYYQEMLAGDHKYKNWFIQGQTWREFENLRECNKQNPDYIEYACSIGEIYAMQGVDGFRMDLGECFPIEFMEAFCKRVKAINPDILIVNERWDYASDEYGNYYDFADTVMNYRATDGIGLWVRTGNFKHLNYVFSRLALYPKEVQDSMWNHTDSHDTPRAMTLISGKGMNEEPCFSRLWDIEGPFHHDEDFFTYEFRKWEAEQKYNIGVEQLKRNKKLLKIYMLLMYSIKGIPMTFSGTELGIVGYKDPDNRSPYPWHIINQIERGFRNEIFQFVCSLGRYRNSNLDILRTGDMPLPIADDSVCKVVRSSTDGTIEVLVNRTNQVQKTNMKYPLGEILLSSNDGNVDYLEPYGYLVHRF